MPRAQAMPIAIADLVALTKPRITLLVVLTCAGGMWLAGPPSALHAVLALVGTALVVAGANTLNMYIERDVDGRMARTRDRPLPARRLAPPVALALGLALGASSIPLLALGVNALTALLALASFALYVLAYTPLKQKTPSALLVGAVPGAMPPLMGWTAATGELGRGGLILFAIMFLWQLPHFIAITLFRTDEYARAGFKILAVERGERAARWHIVGWLAALVPVSLLLVPAGVARGGYLATASLLGAGLFALGLYGLSPKSGARWARGLFYATLAYITILFAVLIVGHGR